MTAQSSYEGQAPSGTPATLRVLTGFTGAPSLFWSRFAQMVQGVARARQVILFARLAEGDTPWRPIATCPEQVDPSGLAQIAPGHLVERALCDGIALCGAGGGVGGHADDIALLTGILGSDQQDLLIFLRGARAPGGDSAALIARLAALSSAPIGYEARRKEARASRDAARLAQALELGAKLAESEEFGRAALAFVNGLAEQFACETVTLVWRAREGMRLRAISHAEKIERRTEASALAEQAAHEALALGSEVIWPVPEGSEDQGAHCHGQYAALMHPGHLITLPIIAQGADGMEQPLGAVLLERRRSGFTAAEQWALRLHCELAQAPLARLHRESRWLALRVGHAIAPSIPRALRPRGLSGRALLMAGLMAVMAIGFVPVPFRLTATAVLRTDSIAYVSAPFDGFMEESATILGDVVEVDAPLFTLERAELDLKRGALLAELAGANREAAIAQAGGALPEMQIAQARAAELTAQLMQVDLQLASAAARAPIAGIVVEGDPAKMIGEPVRRGDMVVTIAALDGLYVEAALAERDLSFLETGQAARLSLLARPRDGVDLHVSRIIPAAQVQDGENVFPLRMSHDGSLPDWALPGMTGVTRIEVGNRPLGWVVTRRLLDYLRLALWI